MAYLEITGIPLREPGEEFGPTVNIELEKLRGLTVLSDNGEVAESIARAVLGHGAFTGEIILNSMRIDPIAPRKRPVGVLGGVPGVIPSRTVKENLDLALKGRELSVAEEVFLVDQEFTEGPLAGLQDVKGVDLDDYSRSILAATRLLMAGCDLMLIRKLPVPGFGEMEAGVSWNPGLQMDALLELKNLLRRFRATWINFLTDPVCVHVLSDRVVVFSDGNLVQDGPLRECLNVPASRLVADFLSFPRMNYKTVQVERDGPYVLLRAGRYAFSASEYIKRYIGSREGQSVVMGVRPEDLGLRAYETGDPTVMNLGKVTRVDSFPGSLIVRLDAEGDEWISMVEPGRTVFTGQLVEFRPDPDRIHIFHPLNGANLLD